MEKIKRYSQIVESPGVSPFCRDENGTIVRYEDHIAALKEIFPDWPGKYPEKTGHYYFRCSTGVIEPRLVYVRDGFMRDKDADNICKYSKPEDWGPCVPMWMKI